MEKAAFVAVLLLAVEHVYILVLEMFLWTRPYGRRVFQQTQEQAQASAVLAANQGLYNGFLAAGLFWSLLAAEPGEAFHLRVFFAGCVAVAGLYGGMTVGRKILFVQLIPATVTLALVLLSHR